MVHSIMLFGQGSNDLYKSVRKNQSLINDVYRQVITNYVDEIDYKTDESQKESFAKSINNYLDIKESDIWPDYSGIRPKIQAKGESFKDFYIKNEVQRGFKNFINLIGIDSPGLTSSLAIANHVRGLIL